MYSVLFFLFFGDIIVIIVYGQPLYLLRRIKHVLLGHTHVSVECQVSVKLSHESHAPLAPCFADALSLHCMLTLGLLQFGALASINKVDLLHSRYCFHGDCLRRSKASRCVTNHPG